MKADKEFLLLRMECTFARWTTKTIKSEHNFFKNMKADKEIIRHGQGILPLREIGNFVLLALILWSNKSICQRGVCFFGEAIWEFVLNPVMSLHVAFGSTHLWLAWKKITAPLKITTRWLNMFLQQRQEQQHQHQHHLQHQTRQHQ